MTLRSRALSWLAVFLPLAAIVVVLSLTGAISGPIEQTVIRNLILLIAVVGYYIFVGNSGVLSFGHVVFMVVGAYVTGILGMSPESRVLSIPGLPSLLRDLPQFTPFTACLLGGVVALVFAAALSVPMMRLAGVPAALTSFAVLQAVYVFVAHAQDITGATGGLSGISPIGGVVPVLLTSLAAIGLALSYQRSRWGLLLRASREDAVAAAAVGINVHRQRTFAYILSGFVMGVAGGFYAEFLGTISPDTLYLSITFMILMMLVTGGQKSLSGAVIGCAFIALVDWGLGEIQSGVQVGAVNVKGPVGLAQVGLAVILLAVLIWRPRGLTGGREIRLGRLGARTTAGRGHEKDSVAGSRQLQAPENTVETNTAQSAGIDMTSTDRDPTETGIETTNRPL